MPSTPEAPAVERPTVERGRGGHGVSPRISKRKLPRAGRGIAAGAGAFPDFKYRGGPIIANPRVHTVYLGDWSSSADQTRADRLDQFLSDLMNSDYMNMLAQYGCGASGTVVDRTFIASTDHDLDQSDIESIFQTAIDGNTLPEPDASTLFVLFLDDATGVRGTFGTDFIGMCEATNDNAFGFHFHFVTSAGNLLPYAVVPGLTDDCLDNSCSSDGSCSLHHSQTREERQTQVLSHEFSEAITNPDVEGNEGWSNDSGAHENGDICNGQSGTLTVGANSWNVQLMYSKYDDQRTDGATTCVLGSSFPLPSLLPACTVVLDRSTFGRDEVDAFLSGPAHVPAIFDAALYVAVDGFAASDLGISAGSFSGAPDVQPTFSFAPGVSGMHVTATALSAPDQTALDIIQRFTWTCRVTFDSLADFPTTAGDTQTLLLTAGISTVTGSADVLLVDEPNPYELDGATSWLSTDLRVFQIRAGDTRFAETMGTNPSDGPTYIQHVIGRLNAGATGADTFDAISTDETDSALELSETVNGTRVFNFALARVRYRSLTADAHSVRAFFRLFPAATTSTIYDVSSTYRRGGSGGNTIPLLGVVGGQTTTIPCFAAARIDSSAQALTEQTDAPNVQDIPADSAGAEVVRYFGCWLDINQASDPQYPIAPSPVDGPFSSGRQTIQQLIRNAHQCLTLEIDMDGATLVRNGDTPGSSDKLAQRNLSIVASDNPGSPASHRIATTFEIKPSAEVATARRGPDELLIDWGDLPAGSEATLFMPGTSSADIVRLADELYPRHRLRALDAQTLACPPEGVTYVPIPGASGPNYAGLLVVDLPDTVRKGDVHRVVVRQLTDAFGKRVVPPPIGAGDAAEADGGELIVADRSPLVRWRKVLGSFQLTIPVRTKTVMLEPEERLLGNLRYIGEAIPPADRWAPVFERYVDIVADRVKALGGDPDQIKPSPGDEGKGHHGGGGERELSYVGRVSELLYDRFGEFAGFHLDTEDGERRFGAREPDLERLMHEAWEDRVLIRVTVERHDRHHPLWVALLRPGRHH